MMIQTSIEQFPNHGNSQMLLAEIYKTLEKYDLAIKVLKKQLVIDPEDVQVRDDLEALTIL